MLLEIIFYAFASVLICASLGVILFKNPVYSAVSLILAFITIIAKSKMKPAISNERIYFVNNSVPNRSVLSTDKAESEIDSSSCLCWGSDGFIFICNHDAQYSC